MTQPPTSLPPDPDELASAIVDGLLPPAEADAARRDPAVARRVDEMLRVQAAVRAVPAPPPEAAVNHAVAAATAVFDAHSPESGDRPARPLHVVSRSPQPPELGRASSDRSRSSVPGGWLAAAAVILVVLGLVLAGIANQSGDDEDTATGAVSGDDEATGEESGAEGADGGGGDASSDAPTAAEDDTQGDGETSASTLALVPDLGAVAGVDALADRVQANLGLGRDASSAQVAGGGPDGPPDTAAELICAGLSFAGDPARGTQEFVAEAMLDGTYVVVHLYRQGSDVRLVATDESCSNPVDVPYEG